MITNEQIIEIGSLDKPHGIKGEITATLDYDLDLTSLKCIVVAVDSINVPFFVDSQRPKGRDTVIVAIDGINSDTEAKALCGHTFAALSDDVEIDTDAAPDGGYMSDFIGYSLTDIDGNLIGNIADFDDSTENLLFIVETPQAQKRYIPVADDLISDIDPKNKQITMDLPEGILEI